ncbi:hypothetical protein [Oceanisphaera arctica]|uniref:DUF3106 domain-containing protein n=1 Tax=Oceanisphaera arctica TaxID=641510 RepID=A0A2P5TLR7_9GAMM|nr:hypothetical protein [Oceanisphaera arctica]PPL16305.1 hypothetical protein UN63_09565 [Oceanisphaera arctica]GHA28764.1 hypothetical protein GCM10007082_31120 [Oceanisphaera arctica]
MNRALYCGVLALMLTGCSLPFSLPYQQQADPIWSPASDNQELNDWLQLSADMMHSSEAERQQQVQKWQQMSANSESANKELKLALWLSHPRASISQRQQAQQLFKQHLPAVNTRVQQFFGAYQGYNQELLNQQRQLAERQQQVDTLTRKLKELASIDEQINERKFRE